MLPRGWVEEPSPRRSSPSREPYRTLKSEIHPEASVAAGLVRMAHSASATAHRQSATRTQREWVLSPMTTSHPPPRGQRMAALGRGAPGC